MAWTLATGAAVTLSWWGVHTVMSGTAYDPPRALPLSAGALSSSTHGAAPPSSEPAPSPSSSPSPSAPSAAPSRTPAAATASPHDPHPASSAVGPRPSSRAYDGGGSGGSGHVKSYPVTGGLVVFDLGTKSAELVSATPSDGWRMQVWKQPTWIRVTFTRDDREVSVFCTWHDHPPLVETYQSDG
ncbi:hypothetical protein [Streptomyces sp. NPDC101132]|uniref:hypothetical protein n=1 Tax=Streptomyces sp. NPDC101132 TaxID=3366110 RepID=UPI003829B72D